MVQLGLDDGAGGSAKWLMAWKDVPRERYILVQVDNFFSNFSTTRSHIDIDLWFAGQTKVLKREFTSSTM